ncbi:MAG TPA: hypothetical protein PL108_08635 [Sediminibacterium sp.]|nr:hypothetical protein [Sediminibacterium sp.]
MRLFITIFSLFLLPHCKYKVESEHFKGYIAYAGNSRLILEDIESEWAGGGPAQKLSIIKGGYLVFDTLLFPPTLFFPDSVSFGKPTTFFLSGFSWVSSLNKKEKILFEENDILVKSTFISIDHTISPFYDSCSRIRYGEKDIHFYSENEEKWINYPRYKIRFINRREVEVISSKEPYNSMTFRMEEKLAKKLISNLAKGQ